MGSSLLWSALPLVVNPITGARDLAFRKVPSDDRVPLLELRREIEESRCEESLQVFRGLQLLFDRGDSRVLVVREFLATAEELDDIPMSRIKEIIQAQIDLYDEALATAA